MQVYEALAKALAHRGVDTMFGVMGDANMLLVTSYQQLSGTRYVAATHEAGAVTMAAGYAAAGDRMGLATTTHGPALTNTLTALTDAVRSRTPLVLLVGDTAPLDWRGIQNLPQRDHVMPTGAGFISLRSPDSAVEDLVRALDEATASQHPVVLNLPVDMLKQEVDYLAPALPHTTRPGIPDEHDLDEALGLIAASRRPVIVAGRGAARREARKALLHLAEVLGAPVATTLRAKDLFRDEPNDLGYFGSLSSPSTSAVIADADCLVFFGSSLSRHTAYDGDLLRGKRVVQCDADPSAIGRSFPVGRGLLGDAAATAQAMVDMLLEAGHRSGRAVAASITPGEASSRPAPARSASAGTVPLWTALEALEDAFPPKRTLTCDAGRFMLPALKVLSVPEPYSYVHTASIGSIGLAMGNAVGAWHAKPDQPVLAVIGDGGFMLGGLGEFNSAVRSGADIVVALINDGAYGAEFVQLERYGMDPAPSQFEWPDLAAVAVALGGSGFSIREEMDLERLGEVIAGRDAPILLDFHIDPYEVETDR